MKICLNFTLNFRYITLSPLIIAGYEIMTKKFKLGLEKVRRGLVVLWTQGPASLYSSFLILIYLNIQECHYNPTD